MKRTDMTKVDCYPWAQPTEKQKALFDQLPPEEQLEMVRQAPIEGGENGVAGPLDMAAIRRFGEDGMVIPVRVVFAEDARAAQIHCQFRVPLDRLTGWM